MATGPIGGHVESRSEAVGHTDLEDEEMRKMLQSVPGPPSLRCLPCEVARFG